MRNVTWKGMVASWLWSFAKDFLPRNPPVLTQPANNCYMTFSWQYYIFVFLTTNYLYGITMVCASSLYSYEVTFATHLNTLLMMIRNAPWFEIADFSSLNFMNSYFDILFFQCWINKYGKFQWKWCYCIEWEHS